MHKAPQDDQAIYRGARRKVLGTIGFRWHARAYLLVSILLFVINVMTTPAYLWALFPIVAWGVAVLLHFFAVRDHDEREALIEQEVRRKLAEREGRAP